MEWWERLSKHQHHYVSYPSFNKAITETLTKGKFKVKEKIFKDSTANKIHNIFTSQRDEEVKWQNSKTNQIQNRLEHNRDNLNKFREIGIIIDEELYNDPTFKLYEKTFDFNKLKELRKRWFIWEKINNIWEAKQIIDIKDLDIDFDKFSQLKKFWINNNYYTVSYWIKKATTIKVDFNILNKLKKAGITIDSLDTIEVFNNVWWEINFKKLKKLNELWLDIQKDDFSDYDITRTKRIMNLKIDFKKLNKLKEEFWIKIARYNIEQLNNLEIDFKILKSLKENLWVEITDLNIEKILKLNLSDKEISLCKKYWIKESNDIVFFVNNIKKVDREKIQKFIKRKNDYLEKHRTLEEQKFIELFWGKWFKIWWQDWKKWQIWKYWKIEINQTWLWYCYAYTWFELLKKTNGFNELIQTNLRETENWWEVRLPFCDKNWTWIKINKDEIDKKFIIEEDWEERNVSINSESEYLWFKILEIAFIKKSIINKCHALNHPNESLLKAYNQFEENWDLTITWELLTKIEWWLTEKMLYTILPKNYIIWDNLHLIMKELGFNQFSKGLYKIALGISFFKMDWLCSNCPNIIITKSPYWKAVIVNDVKIINKRWVKFKSHFSINNEWKLSDNREKDWDNGEDTKDIFSDIVTNKEWKEVVMFFRGHAYSIERCYEDKNTWKKRVRVINPEHTGIKFDISLEQAKQIFDWQVTGINIDQMFREEDEGKK